MDGPVLLDYFGAPRLGDLQILKHLYVQRTGIQQQLAGAVQIKALIRRGNVQEEPVVRSPRKPAGIEERVVRARQSVEGQHPPSART